MRNAVRITPMERLRRMARDAGSHWFDPDTLRFFKSRVGREAYLGADGRWYFLSSEQGPRMPRRYSVRAVDDGWAHVESFGGFQAYDTRAQALTGLRHALKLASRRNATPAT
jgi:hypothetical protein